MYTNRIQELANGAFARSNPRSVMACDVSPGRCLILTGDALMITHVEDIAIKVRAEFKYKNLSTLSVIQGAPNLNDTH